MKKLSKKQATLIALTLVLGLGLFGCGKRPEGNTNTNTNQNQNTNVNINQNVNQNQNVNLNFAIDTTTNELIDTVDWKIYKNEKYGFEFEYPEEWGYLLNGTGTIGFGREFFGKNGEDLPLFDADFLIYPSFDKKYFDFERKRGNISETTFKNNQGLIFILLDGIISGQEEQTPLWRWRNYYLQQGNNYLRLSCLNQMYNITEKKWIIRNSKNFCDELIRQVKITK